MLVSIASILIISLTFYFNNHDSSLAAKEGRNFIRISVAGKVRNYTTSARTVGEALSKNGIKLDNSDHVYPGLDTAMDNVNLIEVSKSISNLVVDKGFSKVVNSGSPDPREVVEKSGLSLYPEDNLEVDVIRDFSESRLYAKKITIIRATPINLVIGGISTQIRTNTNTVGELLKSKTVALEGQDKVSPGLNTVLTDGMTVEVIRYSTDEVSVKEVIAKETEVVFDSSLELGSEKVKTEGYDGEKIVTYRVNYQDKKETSREVVRVEVVKEPQKQIIVKGLKRATSFSGSVEYWRPYVLAAASKYGADSDQLMRVMACESGGNALAYNPSGASGLFQFMPSTYSGNGGKNIWDGYEQIEIAAKMFANGQARQWVCK